MKVGFGAFFSPNLYKHHGTISGLSRYIAAKFKVNLAFKPRNKLNKAAIMLKYTVKLVQTTRRM